MSRWSEREDVPRGEVFDARWRALEEAGQPIHGEADLVSALAGPGASILDAGCGTGRVAIELARRGHPVVGVDLDPRMLDTAREKAPELTWIEADLLDVEVADDVGDGVRRFDLIVMPGNVMIFLTPGTEGAVVANMARHLRPGGLLVTGFHAKPGRLQVDEHDAHGAAVGLTLESRWATWEREPWTPDADYAVSVYRAGA